MPNPRDTIAFASAEPRKNPRFPRVGVFEPDHRRPRITDFGPSAGLSVSQVDESSCLLERLGATRRAEVVSFPAVRKIGSGRGDRARCVVGVVCR
jgi:hypothetical protein